MVKLGWAVEGGLHILRHLGVCRGTGRPVRESSEGWQFYEEQIRENPGDACGNGAGGGERGIKRGARSYLQQESFEDGGGAIPVGAEAERDWRDGEIASAGESEWISEGRAGAGREPDPFRLCGEGGEAVGVCGVGERREY